MQTRKVETPEAPKAVGPYSQGIILAEGSSLVFVSGQLPIDLNSGKLLESDLYSMTQLVIDHLEAILKMSGSSLDKVVRCDVFLSDLDDFEAMNKAYGERFCFDPLPARQTIEVAKLPLGAPVEISCIAWRP